MSFLKQASEIIEDIKEDGYLKELWKVYLADNLYVGKLDFLDTVKVVEDIANNMDI